jgi:hypothetical protein
MGRSCHVYDYEGEHLASFTSWDTAHDWAHLQAALGGVATPVELEDRHRRVTRRVWADRCEQLDASEMRTQRTSRNAFDPALPCTPVLWFAPSLSRVAS